MYRSARRTSKISKGGLSSRFVWENLDEAMLGPCEIQSGIVREEQTKANVMGAGKTLNEFGSGIFSVGSGREFILHLEMFSCSRVCFTIREVHAFSIPTLVPHGDGNPKHHPPKWVKLAGRTKS